MQLVPITTNVVSLNPILDEVYSIQHYVIKFISDLPQVDGILWVLRFLPPNHHDKHPNPILKKYAFNFFQVPQTELDIDTVRTILNEYKINNADVVLRDDSTADDLVDVVEGNRVFLPCIYLLNKIDQISIEVCL